MNAVSRPCSAFTVPCVKNTQTVENSTLGNRTASTVGPSSLMLKAMTHRKRGCLWSQTWFSVQFSKDNPSASSRNSIGLKGFAIMFLATSACTDSSHMFR